MNPRTLEQNSHIRKLQISLGLSDIANNMRRTVHHKNRQSQLLSFEFVPKLKTAADETQTHKTHQRTPPSRTDATG